MTEGTKRRWWRRSGTDTSRANPPVVEPSDETTPLADDPAESTGARPPAPAEPTEAEIAAMLARLADYVRVQVRSGVYDRHQLRELTLEAASSETGDPDRADELARRVLSRELQEWHDDAARWGARTDCDRLDEALGELDAAGVLVLPGLLDRDSLAESVRVRDGSNGCVAYLVADIWRAIDTNSLSLTVLDAAGAPAERSTAPSGQVIDALSRVGLLGSPGGAPGRVEVAMIWRRRPPR